MNDILVVILSSIFFVHFIFSLRYFYNVRKIFIDSRPSSNNEDSSLLLFSNKKWGNCDDIPYKCSDNNCDCSRICKSNNYTLSRIYEGQEVIYRLQTLSPGYYCLPKINDTCKPHVSVSVFTGHEWTCLCKYPDVFTGTNCASFVACQVPYHRTSIIFWDHLKNERADLMASNDYYELLNDGKFRFRCNCDKKKDDKGNELLFFDDLPFHCFVDKCKSNIPNSSVKGFDEKLMGCNCGDFSTTRQKNQLENDITSRCTTCIPSYVNNKLKLNALCYNYNSHIYDQEFQFYPSINYFKPISNCYTITLEIEAK